MATKGAEKSAPAKAAPAKAGKKDKAAKAKPLVHDYPRLSKKKTAVLKAQQTKQRALAVAKVIAQASVFFFSGRDRTVQMIAICECK